MFGRFDVEVINALFVHVLQRRRDFEISVNQEGTSAFKALHRKDSGISLAPWNFLKYILDIPVKIGWFFHVGRAKAKDSLIELNAFIKPDDMRMEQLTEGL